MMNKVIFVLVWVTALIGATGVEVKADVKEPPYAYLCPNVSHSVNVPKLPSCTDETLYEHVTEERLAFEVYKDPMYSSSIEVKVCYPLVRDFKLATGVDGRTRVAKESMSPWVGNVSMCRSAPEGVQFGELDVDAGWMSTDEVKTLGTMVTMSRFPVQKGMINLPHAGVGVEHCAHQHGKIIYIWSCDSSLMGKKKVMDSYFRVRTRSDGTKQLIDHYGKNAWTVIGDDGEFLNLGAGFYARPSPGSSEASTETHLSMTSELTSIAIAVNDIENQLVRIKVKQDCLIMQDTIKGIQFDKVVDPDEMWYLYGEPNLYGICAGKKIVYSTCRRVPVEPEIIDRSVVVNLNSEQYYYNEVTKVLTKTKHEVEGPLVHFINCVYNTSSKSCAYKSRIYILDESSDYDFSSNNLYLKYNHVGEFVGIVDRATTTHLERAGDNIKGGLDKVKNFVSVPYQWLKTQVFEFLELIVVTSMLLCMCYVLYNHFSKAKEQQKPSVVVVSSAPMEQNKPKYERLLAR